MATKCRTIVSTPPHDAHAILTDMNRQRQRGFALPTVLLASIVMMIVLMTALVASSGSRATLDQQYHARLARLASESGAQRIVECIASGQYPVVSSPALRPNTDCQGTVIADAPAYVSDVPAANFRTTFTTEILSRDSHVTRVRVAGTSDRTRSAGGSVVQSYTSYQNVDVLASHDPSSTKKSQRTWMFGSRAMLDFGASGGELPTASRFDSYFFAHEGVTVVNDAQGDLQFFSNGQTIWDRTGAEMQNSAGLNGGQSATQAVVAFPMNRERTQYGVISNNGQVEDGHGQLFFSVVDMTLNSGRGAVTGTKNQLLTPPLGVTNYSSEALGAMPSSNGTGFWIYTYHTVQGRTAQIVRYFISVNGTVGPPTLITLNPAPASCWRPTGTSRPSTTGYGTFNFSDDYSRMVLLVGERYCSNGESGRIYVFNADPSNGNLALQNSWVMARQGPNNSGSGYSATFSPSGRYVYATQIYEGWLLRYDLSSNSNLLIKNSEWAVSRTTAEPGNDRFEAGGQIARGPDGRMYIADQSFDYSGVRPFRISYINNPDSATTSTGTSGIDLRLNGLALADGSGAYWGLPQSATVYEPRVIYY